MKTFLIFLLFLAAHSSKAALALNVDWDRSSDTNVVAYSVYYGTSSHSYSSRVSAGTNSTKISGFSAGATYFFSVTALDDSGNESDFSDEVSYSFAADTPPPQNIITKHLLRMRR